MAQSNTRFVDRRVEALALVTLTRRDDLIVSTSPTEPGLDLVVELVKSGRPSRRYLGVQLKGTTRDLPSHIAADRYLRAEARRRARRVDHPFPVCLFLFSMKRSVGYYAWMCEPMLANGQGPKLQPRRDLQCEDLDVQALDQIIERVDRWYDAVNALLRP